MLPGIGIQKGCAHLARGFGACLRGLLRLSPLKLVRRIGHVELVLHFAERFVKLDRLSFRCDRSHADVAKFADDYRRVKDEIAKAVVGHDEIVDGVLTCLFAGGHALLEGVPGLGKTLLIRSLSEALHLQFSRIQFTPDLMPADVTGTTIVVEGDGGRDFAFRKGPIFAQIVLADEINRATPKTQSSLLEAMQEKSVTVGGETHILDKPFFVMRGGFVI